MIGSSRDSNNTDISKENYTIGDSVQVKEYSDDNCFAKILSIKPRSKKLLNNVEIVWYYKPENIFKRVPSFISAAELMESDHKQNIGIESIYDKIQVVSLEEYHKNEEAGSDLYFTRSFFDYKAKRLKPVLSKWDRVCICESIINPDVLYVACDRCTRLFHPNCVIAPEGDSAWYCSKCEQKNIL